MGSYRLTENAKADLERIYRRGLREYGEVQADKYYKTLFERFEQLAEQPLLYQPLTISDQAIAGACAGQTVFTIVSTGKLSISWRLSDNKTWRNGFYDHLSIRLQRF